MRLNAYLARAGVASRRACRRADQGRPGPRERRSRGELNTFVGSGDAVEVDGRRGRASRARLRAAAQAGRDVVTTARDPHGRPTVVDLVGRRAARRPRRPAGRRHDRSAAADERRPARPPARASALRGRQGLRGGRRGRPRRTTRCAASPRASSSTTAAPLPRVPAGSAPGRIELDDPRGPQAPGEADVRGGRPSGRTAAPDALRGPRAWAVSAPGGGASSPATRSRAPRALVAALTHS